MLIDSKRIFFWPAAILIIALSGIIIYQQYQKTTEKNTVTVFTVAGPLKINIEFAKTQQELETGLSNRASLDENSGMLFIFPDENIRSFWMKDTLIPLDLIFIDKTGQIDEILTMELCPKENLFCPTYDSIKPAEYVLEVNAGFAAKKHITEGDILEIPQM